MDVGARHLDAICKRSFSLGPPASSLLTNEKEYTLTVHKDCSTAIAHSLDLVLGHTQSVTPMRSRDTHQMYDHFIGCPMRTKGDHSHLLHSAYLNRIKM